MTAMETSSSMLNGFVSKHIGFDEIGGMAITVAVINAISPQRTLQQL